MRLNKRMTIVISAFGGLSAIIFGAVIIPTVISIKTLREDIAKEYMNIEQRYALRRHTRSSLSAISSLDPILDKLSGMGIIEGKELDFISSLEDAASTSGVEQELTLETVNQKEISRWERDVPIRIKVTGEYPNTISYLERINSLPYYIIISSLDVNIDASRKSDEDSPSQVRMELRGVIRWFSKDHPILTRLSLDDYDDMLPDENMTE